MAGRKNRIFFFYKDGVDCRVLSASHSGPNFLPVDTHTQPNFYFYFYFLTTLKKYEKITLITLNYISDYTLHSKLFKCTLCTLNYDCYYTLHSDVKFAVNIDGKVWYQVKRPNCPYSQSLKNKEEIMLYHLKLYSRLHFAP